MIKLLYVFTYIICNTLYTVQTERILVMFTIPSVSHQMSHRQMTQELAKHGHDVVTITTDPMFPKGKAPERLTEIDIHNASYGNWKENFVATPKSKEKRFNVLKDFSKNIFKVFEKQIQMEEVNKIIAEEKFDLVIVEVCGKWNSALSHVYKVPIIGFGCFGLAYNLFRSIGAMTHFLFYPEMLRRRVYNLTIWETLTEVYDIILRKSLVYESEADERVVMEKLFDNNIPTIDELNEKLELVFLNIYSIWEGNRPAPPAVIYVGGIHEVQGKDLPEDLKNYLDNSPYGVISVSFGTHNDPATFSQDKIQILLKAFSQLPYDVLFKWNKNELPGLSKNVKISKWFPQAVLLTTVKI